MTKRWLYGAAIAAIAAMTAACEPPVAQHPKEETAAAPEGDLEIHDITVGTGPMAKEGSAVQVHYVGTLVDGTQFDSSRDRGVPLTFILGSKEIIQGWTRGLEGMRVGGRRKLVVPPHLGYGRQGSPPKIPGNATLLFDIELLHVVD